MAEIEKRYYDGREIEEGNYFLRALSFTKGTPKDILATSRKYTPEFIEDIDRYADYIDWNKLSSDFLYDFGMEKTIQYKDKLSLSQTLYRSCISVLDFEKYFDILLPYINCITAQPIADGYAQTDVCDIEIDYTPELKRDIFDCCKRLYKRLEDIGYTDNMICKVFSNLGYDFYKEVSNCNHDTIKEAYRLVMECVSTGSIIAAEKGCKYGQQYLQEEYESDMLAILEKYGDEMLSNIYYNDIIRLIGENCTEKMTEWFIERWESFRGDDDMLINILLPFDVNVREWYPKFHKRDLLETILFDDATSGCTISSFMYHVTYEDKQGDIARYFYKRHKERFQNDIDLIRFFEGTLKYLEDFDDDALELLDIVRTKGLLTYHHTAISGRTVIPFDMIKKYPKVFDLYHLFKRGQISQEDFDNNYMECFESITLRGAFIEVNALFEYYVITDEQLLEARDHIKYDEDEDNPVLITNEELKMYLTLTKINI